MREIVKPRRGRKSFSEAKLFIYQPSTLDKYAEHQQHGLLIADFFVVVKPVYSFSIAFESIHLCT